MAFKGKSISEFPKLTFFKTKQREHIHKWIKSKINYDDERKGYPHSFSQDVSFFDSRLPPKQHMNARFWKLYCDAVLDKSLTDKLEKCQTLNWYPQFVKLEAVAVPKDGNCLLHAASFAMWSVHDEHYALRELLLAGITINKNGSYKQRWWRQKLLDLQTLKDRSKIIAKEWEEVVRSISSLSRAGMAKAAPYEFLESVHIYVLSNILRRPIVIVTDAVVTQAANQCGEDAHIAGIYLPLEWPPIKCCKTPLILGFNEGHFSPLLSDTSLRPTMNELLFPLVTRDFCSLPVRFLSQQEEHEASELVQQYFIIKEAIIPMGADGEFPAPCATLHYKNLPPQVDTVMEHFKVCEQLAHQEPAQTGQTHVQDEARLLHQLHINSQTKVAPMRSFSESYHMNMRNQALKENQKVQTQGSLSDEEATEQGMSGVGRCIIKGCSRQGNASRGNFCDSCWKKFSNVEAGAGVTGHLQDVQNQTEMTGPGCNMSQTENAAYITPSAPPASRLNSLEEPLSMLDERCHNKCGYRCSQQTYPYCHECFNIIKANQPVFHSSKSPSNPNNEGLSFLGIAPLNMNDVNNPQGNLMMFSPSPPPALTDPFAHVGNSHMTKEAQNQRGNDYENSKLSEKTSETRKSESERRIKLADGQTMIVQLIPGGVREIVAPADNQEQFRALEMNRTAMSEGRQPAEGDDIIYVSSESASCVSPFCKETVSQPHKLCNKCQAVLLRAQKQHMPEEGEHATPGNVIGEINKDLQTQKLHQIQAEYKNSQEVQDAKTQEAKARQQVDVKVRQRGKPCITSGCLNFGDPANADMCSSCYNKLARKEYERLRREHTKVRAETQSGVHHGQDTDRKAKTEPIRVTNESLLSFAPSSSSHHQAARPAKAHTVTLPASTLVTNKTSLSPGSRGSVHGSLENFATFDINAYNQGFVQEYDKFRDQTSSGLKRCKASSCTNYGNPAKGGFCNSCHAKREERRIQERIAKYGATVPDGWSTQQNSI